MKTFMQLKYYSAITLVLFAAIILLSCDDDNEKSVKVELFSFGPSGVQHGDNITFIGSNLKRVTSIDLPGVSVLSSDFVEHTNEKIILTVPQDAGQGKVTLKTPDADITSKTVLSFDVPVQIAAINAPARPGENLVITGDFLNWVEEVWFGPLQAEITSQGLHELQVMVPFEAETGKLILHTGGTKPLIIQEDIVVALPQVTEYSPSSVKHTEDLVIKGTDLHLVEKVIFTGGTEVSTFKAKSSTEITLAVPKTAATGKLTLLPKSMVEVVPDITLTIILPVATALSPTPASPGTEMTITGTNLDMVKAIKFPGVTNAVTNFKSQSATEIVVDSPAGTSNGALIFITQVDVETLSGVSYVLPGEDLTPLSYVIFDDTFKDNWQDWSWGGPSDAANTEQVRFGTKAIKKTFDGSWDGLQLGNGSSTTAGYTKISISIYGGPDTDGKQANVVLNEIWGSPAVITIQEGEWTEYDITWAQAGAPASPIYRIAIQSQGWAGVIYVDKIGFK